VIPSHYNCAVAGKPFPEHVNLELIIPDESKFINKKELPAKMYIFEMHIIV